MLGRVKYFCSVGGPTKSIKSLLALVLQAYLWSFQRPSGAPPGLQWLAHSLWPGCPGHTWPLVSVPGTPEGVNPQLSEGRDPLWPAWPGHGLQTALWPCRRNERSSTAYPSCQSWTWPHSIRILFSWSHVHPIESLSGASKHDPLPTSRARSF